MKQKRSEKVFDLFNIVFYLVFSFLCIYPFIYVLALSLNDAMDAQKGGIYFIPRMFTLENFKAVFLNNNIILAYGVTIARVLSSVVLVLLFTSMVAYTLTKKDFQIRKFLNWLIVVPMYFSGGMIPYYIILRYTGLLNSFLTYVIPVVFNAFNILMLRTQFREVPDALIESAFMDGAGDLLILFRIILPLNKPVLATIALFTGVGHWNDWQTGFIYINNAKLWCAQNVLLFMLQSNEASTLAFLAQKFGNSVKIKVTAESIKMAMLIITVAPIMLIYPFLQKYFVKGVMIGSLKE